MFKYLKKYKMDKFKKIIFKKCSNLKLFKIEKMSNLENVQILKILRYKNSKFSNTCSISKIF
jgi:hypothetical protein